MAAPDWENLVRLLIAVVATGTAVLVFRTWLRSRGCGAAPLVLYLATVVAANALWRWAILGLGLASEETEQWRRDVEPLVRSIGNALLILLYVGIALIAIFHARRRDA